MNIGHRQQIFFFGVLADEGNQISHLAALSVKNLAFAIDNIFLQIDRNRFGHTEIFHRFRNRDSHFFAQAKKMINGRTCRKNHCAVIEYGDSLLSEFFCCQWLYFDKRTKINVDSIFFSNVEVRRFLRRGFRLRDQKLLNTQCHKVLVSILLCK